MDHSFQLVLLIEQIIVYQNIWNSKVKFVPRSIDKNIIEWVVDWSLIFDSVNYYLIELPVLV